MKARSAQPIMSEERHGLAVTTNDVRLVCFAALGTYARAAFHPCARGIHPASHTCRQRTLCQI